MMTNVLRWVPYFVFKINLVHLRVNIFQKVSAHTQTHTQTEFSFMFRDTALVGYVT